MEIEFVPYELAVKLKELGFDKLCAYAWCQQTKGYPKEELIEEYRLRTDGNPFGSFNEGKNWNKSIDGRNKNNIRCSAPLWQQAFDWLLKNKGLYGIVIPTVTGHWTYKTMTVLEDMEDVPNYKHVPAEDYNTFEEAREELLTKLIKLCNENNN